MTARIHQALSERAVGNEDGAQLAADGQHVVLGSRLHNEYSLCTAATECVVATAAPRPSDQAVVVTAAVAVSGIEESQPRVDRGLQRPHRLLVVVARQGHGHAAQPHRR